MRRKYQSRSHPSILITSEQFMDRLSAIETLKCVGGLRTNNTKAQSIRGLPINTSGTMALFPRKTQRLPPPKASYIKPISRKLK